jgi:hypothetical protein
VIPAGAVHPLAFFARLKWLDGRPLLDTIEEYRRRVFEDALFSFDDDGRPSFDRALIGRAKKNNKTTDLCLAGLYKFLMWPSAHGSDSYILANDESQASDDLSLIKKLIVANDVLASEVAVQAKEIRRRDGKGTLRVLPAGDALGAHGKTFIFCGFDEIHGYKNYDILEAMSPDPSRHDVMTWITSYSPLRAAPGVPLFDLMQLGKRGDDARMFFSWYSASFTTDPDVPDDATPEQRANPSMSSWGNDDYLKQQRRRLPSHRYRRLHLNEAGAPDGAALDADAILAAVVEGRKRLPPPREEYPLPRYHAFVDMSGGSCDDACLAIAYRDRDSGKAVLASLMNQGPRPPFNPRDAVKKFAGELKAFGLRTVTGDAYAGETFRRDFLDHGIDYRCVDRTKSEIYEQFEVALNANAVELLDLPKLQDELMGLVWRGSKIDHERDAHDDWANAACGALIEVQAGSRLPVISPRMMAWAERPGVDAYY